MINLHIDIDKTEAANMWNDIIKFLTIATIVHLLMFSVDNYGDLFDENILKILLYITIGILVYYLIIKKVSNKLLFPSKQQPQQSQSQKQQKSLKSSFKKNKRKNHKKVRFDEQ